MNFREEPLKRNFTNNITKYTINDVIYTSEQCHSRFTLWTYLLLLVSVIFWAIRAITVFFHIIHNYDIQRFMQVALKIDDSELENFTWHEVQVFQKML